MTTRTILAASDSKKPTKIRSPRSHRLSVFVTVTILSGLLATAPRTLAQGETWTTRSDMPRARADAGCAAVDGKIYVIGGVTTAPPEPCISTVEAYDLASDTWEQKADMPTPRCGAATAAVDGRIYVIGGHPTMVYGPNPVPESAVEEYDPSTDSWSTRQPMSLARTHASAATVDGTIYVMGGFSQQDDTRFPISGKPVEAYDPAADSWTDKALPPWPRGNLASVEIDGRIYAMGGSGGPTAPGPAGYLAVYDPGTDAWEQKADIGTGWAGFGAGALGGKVYAVGGSIGGATDPRVMTYDPLTDTWETRSDIPMPQGRMSPCASVVDDKMYVIGGRRFQGMNMRFYASVFELDPGLATAVEHNPAVPVAFALHENYPNPFNPTTILPLDVAVTGDVHLSVYDVLGNQLQVLVTGSMQRGRHEVIFEAGALSSGLYVARLVTSDGIFVRNMLLLK